MSSKRHGCVIERVIISRSCWQYCPRRLVCIADSMYRTDSLVTHPLVALRTYSQEQCTCILVPSFFCPCPCAIARVVSDDQCTDPGFLEASGFKMRISGNPATKAGGTCAELGPIIGAALSLWMRCVLVEASGSNPFVVEISRLLIIFPHVDLGPKPGDDALDLTFRRPTLEQSGIHQQRCLVFVGAPAPCLLAGLVRRSGRLVGRREGSPLNGRVFSAHRGHLMLVCA